MEKSFWHERWAKNETGFHLDQTNPFLVRHWKTLHSTRSDKVFVPLCGKSLDLLWLAERVTQVIGVELSTKAVEEFFSDNKLNPAITQSERFVEYRYNNITILCGDFFQLEATDIPSCRLIYDRACLIAIPPDMRHVYAKKLLELFPHGTQTLLVTLEYPQDEMNGPPFSVQTDEVERLYDGQEITYLEAKNILDKTQRFKDKGISSLIERVFVLKK